MFQACPKCGFAYGEASGEVYTTEQVWIAIEDHSKKNRKELFEESKTFGRDDFFDGPMWKFTDEDVKEFKKLKLPVYE
jgi:hypothetical protein